MKQSKKTYRENIDPGLNAAQSPSEPPPDAFGQLGEPELFAAAVNARDFMEQAFRELAAMRQRLYRGEPGCIPPAETERTLEGVVRGLSTSAACLVGELRTIAAKLG